VKLLFAFFYLFLCSVYAFSPVENYFKSFPDLHKSGEFATIVLLGEEALAHTPSHSDATKIHAQLASTCFYIGEMDLAETHARLSYELSCAEDDERGQIRGLYLLSTTARGRKEFSTAIAIARLALPLTANKKERQDLRAKILYNLGNAYSDDPQGNLAAAEEAYKEAIVLFQTPEDRLRCLDRLGTIYLEQEHLSCAISVLDQVKLLLNEIAPNEQMNRTKAKLLYLEARIEKKRGLIENAQKIASRAFELAASLGLKNDMQRIELFMKAL